MSSEAGKGSTQRPRSIADEEWASRWDAIFQKDKPQQTKAEDDLLGHRNQPEAQQDMVVCNKEGAGDQTLVQQ